MRLKAVPLLIATISLMLTVFALTNERAPATKADSEAIRQALANSPAIQVYEGLPHQAFERDLLAKESKREDTKKIGSFRFYTPAQEVEKPEVLKQTVSSSESIHVFGGAKLCGGFHPDYALAWNKEDETLVYALICFGCHEIIYLDGKQAYRYDLSADSQAKLRKELASFAKKRPERKRQ